MQFEIHTPAAGTGLTWRLVTADGAVAQAPRAWETEADVRAAIAAFRKSTGGVRFAKVTNVTK